MIKDKIDGTSTVRVRIRSFDHRGPARGWLFRVRVTVRVVIATKFMLVWTNPNLIETNHNGTLILALPFQLSLILGHSEPQSKP